MRPTAQHDEHDPLLEARARAALEQRYARALTQDEWDCAKRDLLALAKIFERCQPAARQVLTLLAFPDERE